MNFDTEIQRFLATHPYQQIEVDGIAAKYLLCGKVQFTRDYTG